LSSFSDILVLNLDNVQSDVLYASLIGVEELHHHSSRILPKVNFSQRGIEGTLGIKKQPNLTVGCPMWDIYFMPLKL
jgi:hypothetical protein